MQLPVLVSIRYKLKKNCSLVFSYFPNHFFLPSLSYQRIQMHYCILSWMPQDPYNKPVIFKQYFYAVVPSFYFIPYEKQLSGKWICWKYLNNKFVSLPEYSFIQWHTTLMLRFGVLGMNWSGQDYFLIIQQSAWKWWSVYFLHIKLMSFRTHCSWGLYIYKRVNMAC